MDFNKFKLDKEYTLLLRYATYALALVLVSVVIFLYSNQQQDSRDTTVTETKTPTSPAQTERSRLADQIARSKPMNGPYLDMIINSDDYGKTANTSSDHRDRVVSKEIPENMIIDTEVSQQVLENSNSDGIASVTVYLSPERQAKRSTSTTPQNDREEIYKEIKGSIFKFDPKNNNIILSKEGDTGLVAISVTDQTKILINNTEISFSDLKIADKIIVEGYGLSTESTMEASTITIYNFLQTAP